MPVNPLPDLINSLEGIVEGEFRTDSVTRLLYSTDASIYQIEPMGVFFPRNIDDLSACVEAANQYSVPILARGSGSSLAGQAVGPGLIIDCSRYLNKIIEINPEDNYARVEPGVILSNLNDLLTGYGLQFGPDPASAERATIGGVIANNAAGAHSISYGMTADNLLSVDLVLSDGSLTNFTDREFTEIERIANIDNREGEIYRAALGIRGKYTEEIMRKWPRTWRRASGYNLNYLLPWSPSKPQQWSQFSNLDEAEAFIYPAIGEGRLNLAALIAGSEGTLGIIRQAVLRLVEKPKHSVLALLSYPSLESACDAVSEILEFRPAAIELIPANMIRLARTIPSYARQVELINDLIGSDGSIPNLLAVEFTGADQLKIQHLAKKVSEIETSGSILAIDQDQQEQIWNVRKVGLGLLMSKPGDFKPIPFIEDISIPVERLSEFVREMEKLLNSFNTNGDFYAHASVGCLHIRPLVNLKTVEGVSNMREIADEAIKIITQLGGVPSGEHGDGLARSEWLQLVFGSEIYNAFQELKRAADPKNILNPGKIIDSPRMDENLRYKIGESPPPWQTALDFSKQGGLVSAVELCNGAGVCRKQDGLMCPSFQATNEELHSTRGRANLMRALFTGDFSLADRFDRGAVFEALELCIACKGCKAECPSAVDMAKLKYEYLDWYYRENGNRHPVRDYLFAHVGDISRYGAKFKTGSNYILANINNYALGGRWLGLSKKRELPLLNDKSLRTMYKESATNRSTKAPYLEKVLFLSDPFTEYYQPEIGLAAIKTLHAADCEVEIIPTVGSGRTLISKGFLAPARKHAEKVIHEIGELDPGEEAFIVGIEPSEIFTLRDEYLDLLPTNPKAKSIAERAMMIDEFLVRPRNEGDLRILRIANNNNHSESHLKHVLLHGHCYQKTQPPAKDGYSSGVLATAQMLRTVGYSVEIIETGCCGMAGAFGYEVEHFDLSMEIGELSLFPKVRSAGEEAIITTSGFSCLTHIKDGTGREPVHPMELLPDQ